MNIATLAGGEAANIVADHAEAVVSFRSSINDIEERVRAVIKKSGVVVKATTALHQPPTDHRLSGFKRHEVSYFTEMAFFENSVVCGPGDIRDAHTAHERVSRAELAKAVEFYGGLIEAT
jgi:acetylornithine deacetylase